jgi:hypothetical protein
LSALTHGIRAAISRSGQDCSLKISRGVVGAVSTALFEAEAAGLPVFGHDVPLFERVSLVRLFPSFTTADELRALLIG